jgi:hypothetical protein
LARAQLKSRGQFYAYLYLLFIAIDMVILNGLLTMGVMMMSLTTMALPLKIIAFVLVDGWTIPSSRPLKPITQREILNTHPADTDCRGLIAAKIYPEYLPYRTDEKSQVIDARYPLSYESLHQTRKTWRHRVTNRKARHRARACDPERKI